MPGGRAFVAVVAGLGLALAFPNPWSRSGLPYLAYPAVAIATLTFRSARPIRATWIAFLFSATFCGITLAWLSVVGPDAWAGLGLMSAVLMTPLGPFVALTARLRWWPALNATAWVLVESVRSRIPFGGFSWARLAFATPGTPVSRLALLGGAPLVTFAVALAASMLALAWERRRGVRPTTWAVCAAIVVVICGALLPVAAAGEGRGGPPVATVALVQGDVPRPGIDFLGRPEQVLTNHVRETVSLAADVAAGRAGIPAFVIWPENASDLDPFSVSSAHDLIDVAVRTIDRPILVGTLTVDPADPNRVLNTGIVWDPTTGPGQRYIKQHLVPFGEYVPFRAQLTKLITRFDRVPRDFAPGRTPGTLEIGGIRIADVICFEIAYDSIPRNALASGARLLVVQTNNATYGATAQPAQQLEITRLRAIEHGRTVVVASTSGISAIIDAAGRVVAEAPTFAPAYLDRQVTLRDSTTIADRLGGWPEAVLALTPLAGLAMALRGRRLRSERR